MTSTDPEQLMPEVIRSLGRIDRRLWTWAIRRALRSPTSRFYVDLPRRGLRAATYNLLATFWAASAVVGFLGVPATFVPDPFVADVLIAICVVLMTLCVIATTVEASRTSHHTRAFRAAAEPGGHEAVRR